MFGCQGSEQGKWGSCWQGWVNRLEGEIFEGLKVRLGVGSPLPSPVYLGIGP